MAVHALDAFCGESGTLGAKHGTLPAAQFDDELLADYSADHPQWAEAVKLLPEAEK